MALALNNLKRVDMPLNKETKPNQTLGETELCVIELVLQLTACKQMTDI